VITHNLYANDTSYWEVINSLCTPYVTHTQPIGQLAYKLTHLLLRLRLVRIHTLYWYTQLICNNICYGVRAPWVHVLNITALGVTLTLINYILTRI